METFNDSLPSSFPQQVNLFGSTRLEKAPTQLQHFAPRFVVRVRFTGVNHGELRVWCDLDVARLKSEERAQSRGILTETANILAGVSLSDLADRLNGHVMLAPPILEESLGKSALGGTDYRLHLFEGFCNCRVEVVTKDEK